MQISEITAGLKKVDCTGTIAAIGERRTVNLKSGGTNTVADAIIHDASGKITLPLWGKDVDVYRVGDKVSIQNGYVTSYKGNLQLSIGKYGRLSRLEL